MNSDKESYFEVWMFLIYIVIVYFIKYELDEFELNWVNIYVWYDLASMFVNDMEWQSRHSIFRKGDIGVEIVRMCIAWRFDVLKYSNSTSRLDSHRWNLPISEESEEIDMTMSEIWNISLSE